MCVHPSLPHSLPPSLPPPLLSLQDGLEMFHWRREADQGKTYPYAKFSKSLDIPSYTEEEYKVRAELSEGVCLELLAVEG